MHTIRFLLILTAGVLSLPLTASAQTEFDYKGSIQSDLRASIPGNDRPDDAPDFAFQRTDNIARITAAFSWGSVGALADLAFVFSGHSQVESMEDLTRRQLVDDYYIESSALYIEITDFLFPGVDLRLGRQKLGWGSADMFNPTSVVNGYDLEDPIDFGRQVANEMAVLSISPDWRIEGEETPILDEINLSLVAVPRFRSGLLPRSALYAFSEPDQFRRFVRSDLLDNLVDLQNVYLLKGGNVLYDLSVQEPEPLVENTQIGARLGFSLFGVDLSAMYYQGYDHNNQPGDVRVRAELVDPATLDRTPYALPDLNDLEFVMTMLDLMPDDGLKNLTGFTDVTLVYPEVKVVGADVSTSLDSLGGVGVWAEFAMTFHDGVLFDIDINDQLFEETQIKPGKFWKLTAGFDYTITKWWYVNVQYIHGFVNEFGAENLNDFIVAGFDFKTFDEQVLIRLFSILQVEPGPQPIESFVLFPQLSFKFWQNTELMAGALIFGGSEETTFGNRVSGPNTVFMRGTYAF